MTTYGSFFGCGSFAAPGPFMEEVTPERHTTSDGTCHDQTEVSPDKAFRAYWTYSPTLDVDGDGNPATTPLPQGVTMSGAIDWIGAVLNDSRGWARANVRFQFIDPLGETGLNYVTFRYFPEGEAACGEGYLGCFYCFSATTQGLIRMTSAGFGPGGYLHEGVITHESGHGFFGAEHNPSTSSVMYSAVPMAWPSDGDIDDLKAWLGI